MTIVADTGAILALVDRSDKHHEVLLRLHQRDPGAWLLPWAILPEVDYLLATRVGAAAQAAFLRDVATGAWAVEWGTTADLVRAQALHERYPALRPGLVDGSVIAVAERLRAGAIATLDLRHFAVIEILGEPALYPRDV